MWAKGARRDGASEEGNVLDLNRVDIEVIATALADQADGEHRWLIDPATGDLVIWTSDTGIDGHNPVELEDLGLSAIDPVPSYVWYQDMVDFADQISDRGMGERLFRAPRGPRGVRSTREQDLPASRADRALADHARHPRSTPSRRLAPRPRTHQPLGRGAVLRKPPRPTAPMSTSADHIEQSPASDWWPRGQRRGKSVPAAEALTWLPSVSRHLGEGGFRLTRDGSRSGLSEVPVLGL